MIKIANLTLIQAMTKTADLVYQRVKTLLGQSGGGGITLNTNTETAIGTLDGKTVYRQVFDKKGITPIRDLADFNTFSKIVKLELYVFITNTVAVNLSNYVKIESGTISTTNEYPTRYADPDFSWICVVEYLK